MTKKAGNGFEAMGLSETMLAAIKQAGFEEPSPIQAALIPVAISGVDCIGQAHTGTGKTAAFMIPILEELDFKTKRPLALIMVPTRELSEQVAQEGRKLAVNRKDVGVVSIVGGKSMHDQTTLLKKGAQILVGTPGRVLDMLGRGHFDPQTLEFVVLDEADRMLDIGFRPDIEKILKRCPNERQTLLLSATLPPPVERLAKRYMFEPQMIDLSKDEVSSHGIKQYYVTVDQDRKLQTLVRLLAQERPQQALVFTRTKRGADLLHAKFKKRLSSVETLHGDLPQTKRDKVMQRFRSGETRLLIATDVVGRGIDIRGISHIINYDIPEFCDDYVHRIGRAGRMSSSSTGSAFTFVTREQGGQLTSIELRINKLIEPYTIKDFEPVRTVKKVQHVSDLKQPPRSFG